MKTSTEKLANCKSQLVNLVIRTVAEIEKAADKGYEAITEYLEDKTDVKITIDGNLRYNSVIIQIGIGGPNLYFNSSTSEVVGTWGSLHFSQTVNYEACDMIDDYFEDYYNICKNAQSL